MNKQRTQEDIMFIGINTIMHADSWDVEITYKDGKRAHFFIDYPKDSVDMLKETFEAIEMQLSGTVIGWRKQ